MLIEKMPGHTHPGKRESNPIGDFHIKNGKRNRNAETAVEHIVQERIPRIIIVFAISAQFHFVEQHAVQRTQRVLLAIADLKT